MGWLLGTGIVAGTAAVMWAFAVLARRIRRRGTAGQAIAAAMAAYDEAFHSTAYDRFIELRAQDERSQQVTIRRRPR